jgi:hypothetical protein
LRLLTAEVVNLYQSFVSVASSVPALVWGRELMVRILVALSKVLLSVGMLLTCWGDDFLGQIPGGKQT